MSTSTSWSWDGERGSRLRPGTALFLWADQNAVRSITKRDSVIELDGATLGGGGRLHVIGTLDAHASTTGSPAVLTTRPEDSAYAGPRGILEIGDEGLLDVHGSSSLRLSTAYIVDVHGKARLRDKRRPGGRPRHDVHAPAALLRLGARQAGRPQRR